MAYRRYKAPLASAMILFYFEPVIVVTNVVYLLFSCSFSSGGEDGYVRVHFFDADYYHIKV